MLRQVSISKIILIYFSLSYAFLFIFSPCMKYYKMREYRSILICWNEKRIFEISTKCRTRLVKSNRGQVANLRGQKAAFPSHRERKRTKKKKKEKDYCSQFGQMSLFHPRVSSEKEIQERQNCRDTPVAQNLR